MEIKSLDEAHFNATQKAAKRMRPVMTRAAATAAQEAVKHQSRKRKSKAKASKKKLFVRRLCECCVEKCCGMGPNPGCYLNDDGFCSCCEFYCGYFCSFVEPGDKVEAEEENVNPYEKDWEAEWYCICIGCPDDKGKAVSARYLCQGCHARGKEDYERHLATSVAPLLALREQV